MESEGGEKNKGGEGRHICQQFMEEHGTLVGFSMVLMVLYDPKSNPFPDLLSSEISDVLTYVQPFIR